MASAGFGGPVLNPLYWVAADTLSIYDVTAAVVVQLNTVRPSPAKGLRSCSAMFSDGMQRGTTDHK